VGKIQKLISVVYIIKEIMVREFKFFRGYKQKTITEQYEELTRRYPITTPNITWFGPTTNTPTWLVNPGLIQYTPSTYTIPNYTITTTPGTGTYTIPYNGTINTATGFSLTTSNPNGTTYTTGGFGGTLTTNTATFRSRAFTTKFM
jgi:hypothetical protein